MAENKKSKSVYIALKRFVDSQTGNVYEKGAEVADLDEKRAEELKQRGFIKDND